MEVAILQPSHLQMDPSFSGQTPNMYLTGMDGQHDQERSRRLHSSSGMQQGQSGVEAQAVLSPSHADYSDELLDSPHLSGVSWEELSASPWAAHTRLINQQNITHQESRAALQMQLGNMHFDPTGAQQTYPHSEHGHVLLSPHNTLPGSSPMDYSLSTSASPMPELLGQEQFSSQLGPSTFDTESHSQQMPSQAGQNQPHGHHRHVKPTSSPSSSRASPEEYRSQNPQSNSKRGSIKITKSTTPTGPPTSAPKNTRKAHSAIERKYRENINNKIAELHNALSTAGPSLFPDQETEIGAYPYTRLSKPEDDDFSGVETASTSSQTAISAKKADVLSGAISYVKRSEHEKKILMDQISSLTSRLHHMEAIIQGRNPGMG